MKVLFTLFAFASAAIASPIPDFPFLYIKGQAVEHVPTKSARITFDITNENEDAKAGEVALQEANRAVVAALKEIGIADSAVDTSDVIKRKVDKRDTNGESQKAYFEFTKNFQVTVDNLELYPVLAERFIGSNDVGNFDVRFYAGDLREVDKRLRIAAVKDANEQAEVLASAAGVELDGIHSVSDCDVGELSSLMGYEEGISLASPVGRDAVYKVPQTVPHFFGIRILYRLSTNNNKAKHAGADQPATRPETKSEGSDKLQPESEGRSR
jgi:uncharacterized protein